MVINLFSISTRTLTEIPSSQNQSSKVRLDLSVFKHSRGYYWLYCI